ncbi:MAG: HlyD family efflux transporter periplasmic adaptor subunit [Bacteroidales bacterium]|nr:HlyD family efflux transporter periplasmic adaptor subunit [Bacteroidales bacterium]
MQDKEKDIELRSEEVQEILGRPPQWLVQWGITVVFTVIAGLFIGSYFFQYPEIVTAPIVVTTENLPANVVAKTNGRVDSLFVGEKQAVQKGQLLAVIENPANLTDMLWLMQRLDSLLPTMNEAVFPELSWPSNLELGAVQSSYGSLLKAWADYGYFLKTDYHRKKIAVIEKQIAVQRKMQSQSHAQLSLMQGQLEVANKLFATDSLLFTNGVIAALDYERAKNARLQSLREYESAKSGLEAQQMGILQLEQSIFDLEQQHNEQSSQLQLAVRTACDYLLSQMKSWEQSCLLRSPVKGIVTFTKYWQTNQNIQTGETLLTIVPESATQITGKIYLPPQGAGKVKVGQTVNVKLDNFPYLEYGMVKVAIKNIALVPIVQENVRYYVLEVDFPDDLQTNYGKTLPFSQEMQGTAEIVTDDLRLLDRFLRPIKALWVN